MKKGLVLLTSEKYPSEKTLYDVKVEDKTIKLFYSKIDSSWTKPGELGYTLEDTGNNLIFTDILINKTVTLDYDQMAVLRALLKLEDKSGTKFIYFDRK